jgi:hypothetical protein
MAVPISRQDLMLQWSGGGSRDLVEITSKYIGPGSVTPVKYNLNSILFQKSVLQDVTSMNKYMSVSILTYLSPIELG